MATMTTTLLLLRRAAATCAVRRSTTALSTRQRATPAAPRISARCSTQRAFSTEKVTFTFIDAEGEEATVSATPGQSLLDVAHENDIELEGASDTHLYALFAYALCCRSWCLVDWFGAACVASTKHLLTYLYRSMD